MADGDRVKLKPLVALTNSEKDAVRGRAVVALLYLSKLNTISEHLKQKANKAISSLGGSNSVLDVEKYEDGE